MPTKAARSRNQWLTSAESTTAARVTVPASAKSTRSRGQPLIRRRLRRVRSAPRAAAGRCRRPPRRARKRFGDRVVGAVAVLASADDAGLEQDLKVLRDVLLRGVQRLGQLVDRRLAITEAVEESNTHWLANHAKAARDQLSERVRNWVRQAHAGSVAQLHRCVDVIT